MKPTLAAAAVAVFLASSPVNAEVDHHGGHPPAGTFSAGQPADAQKTARIVQVTMTEADGKMLFIPSRIEIAKDEQVRFMLRNSGVLDHEFVLATKTGWVKRAGPDGKEPTHRFASNCS